MRGLRAAARWWSPRGAAWCSRRRRAAWPTSLAAGLVADDTLALGACQRLRRRALLRPGPDRHPRSPPVWCWPGDRRPLRRTHVSGCERRCGAPTVITVDLVAVMLERADHAATTTWTTPTAIYRASFATIRAEADLSELPADAQKVAVRMIHASGDVGLTGDLEVHPRLVSSARDALRAGAPIFTDAEMIASGITRRRLPAGNQVRCLLHDPRVPELAAPLGHHPLGGRGLLVGRGSRWCRGGDRQRPDRAVPPAGADQRRAARARPRSSASRSASSARPSPSSRWSSNP